MIYELIAVKKIRIRGESIVIGHVGATELGVRPTREIHCFKCRKMRVHYVARGKSHRWYGNDLYWKCGKCGNARYIPKAKGRRMFGEVRTIR